MSRLAIRDPQRVLTLGQRGGVSAACASNDSSTKTLYLEATQAKRS